MAASVTRARFIDPMLLLSTDKLLEGANLQYEVKLDEHLRHSGFVALREDQNARDVRRI